MLVNVSRSGQCGPDLETTVGSRTHMQCPAEGFDPLAHAFETESTAEVAGSGIVPIPPGDMTVVGSAEDGSQVIDLVRRTDPDIILMDIRMPRLNGLDATRAVFSMPGDHPKVIMLTTFDADEYVFSALRAGASGFLLKDATAEDMITAVRVVAEGQSLLAPSVTRRLIAEYVSGPKVA